MTGKESGIVSLIINRTCGMRASNRRRMLNEKCRALSFLRGCADVGSVEWHFWQIPLVMYFDIVFCNNQRRVQIYLWPDRQQHFTKLTLSGLGNNSKHKSVMNVLLFMTVRMSLTQMTRALVRTRQHLEIFLYCLDDDDFSRGISDEPPHSDGWKLQNSV